MLSIAKINSGSARDSRSRGAAYISYLQGPRDLERLSFDAYARAAAPTAPAPFWAGDGPGALGLSGEPTREQVALLAHGHSPITSQPLVIGAGKRHVMGLDLTFSAPKDVSVVFSASDEATQAAIIGALQASAKAALRQAEAVATTRHGSAGGIKRTAKAICASVYTHFASRALEPQLHAHAFVFNLGLRDDGTWSALDGKPIFAAKLATGALFRAELAARMRDLGFTIEPHGPYFNIAGISHAQREALSTRSREIAERLRDGGATAAGSALRDRAALDTRAGKAEPALSELLGRFKRLALAIGLTPQLASALRAGPRAPQQEEPALDHAQLLADLTERSSVATPNDALALICEKSMGRWNAERCLGELHAFLQSPLLVCLGQTEHCTPVFTSRALMDLEAQADRVVANGRSATGHAVPALFVNQALEELEAQLSAKIGATARLDEQRAAALAVCCEPGDHAFVEGWAGAGKTTALRAVARARQLAGMRTIGCCLSAAAARNLSREAGIPSRTIASLLLALDSGRTRLDARSAVVLDEAGMVGSREFALLQRAVVKAGAKLICVGDSKQLQPIGAGGIFRTLMDRHGRSEIATIQRQRTDQTPLLDWLASGKAARPLGLDAKRLAAINSLPESARLAALRELGRSNSKTARGLERWRARFDYAWMREAVADLATGNALRALEAMRSRGRLRLSDSQRGAVDELIADWAVDKAPLAQKAIIAATRAEARLLNELARQKLIERGLVRDEHGAMCAILSNRSEPEPLRFAPGDRIAFTQNDPTLGVVNGALGAVKSIERDHRGELLMVVELDDPNLRGRRVVRIPAAFGRFDHAYCLTNHKAQGRTFDCAYALLNPAMADREWSYVALSRSRFATTLYAPTDGLGRPDPESHQAPGPQLERSALIEDLARRMSRTRAKETSLDWERNALPPPRTVSPFPPSLARGLAQLAQWATEKARARASLPQRER